jgi:Cu(I)-responsive transcriptional regulator
MNIGEAAKASGVSAKMIRHYEEVGLMPAAARSDSGYRQYGDGDVHTLRFIRRSRDLGFSIREISELLGLWQNRKRPSRLVKSLAEAHIRALEQKVGELEAMKATLEHLVHCCHGDERPDCPILETLSRDPADVPSPEGAKPGKDGIPVQSRRPSFGTVSRTGPRD